MVAVVGISSVCEKTPVSAKPQLRSLQRSTLALAMALLIAVWTQGTQYPEDSDCLPDQECKGGLEVQYGDLEVKCGDDVNIDKVVDPPTLELEVPDEEDGKASAVSVQMKQVRTPAYPH